MRLAISAGVTKGLASDKLAKLRVAFGVTGVLLLLALAGLVALAAPVALLLCWPSIVSTIERFDRITWLTIALWFMFWASSKANERAQKERAEILQIVRRIEARAKRPAQVDPTALGSAGLASRRSGVSSRQRGAVGVS
jgi:hypothetical protein